MNVLIPLPDQTSENGSASSTSSRAVPWPCTWPCQIAAASDSFMPGSSWRRTWCIACAAISFAMRKRAISCSVLIMRARASSGVASAASANASNHAFVNVVGSPTMRSDACVPSESSSPMRVVAAARVERGVERARGHRARIGLVVAADVADVRRPRRARGVLGRRLEADRAPARPRAGRRTRRSPSCSRSS